MPLRLCLDPISANVELGLFCENKLYIMQQTERKHDLSHTVIKAHLQLFSSMEQDT